MTAPITLHAPNYARRMTTVVRAATTWPAGLLILDTDLSTLWVGDGSTAGGVPVFSVSALEFKGAYDASGGGAGSPALTDGTGTTGDLYRVSVAGTVDHGAGSIAYDVGDLVLYDGANWQKDSDPVVSVAGKVGVVTLAANDLTDVDTASTAPRVGASLLAWTGSTWEPVNGLDHTVLRKPDVIEQLATPPVSPAVGDRYIVIPTATGAWVGQEGNYADWDGSAWLFTTPVAGDLWWSTVTFADGCLRYVDHGGNVVRVGGHLHASDGALVTPPGAPSAGDVYLVLEGAGGAWAGKAGQIATYDGAAWRFEAPAFVGTTLMVGNEERLWLSVSGGTYHPAADANNALLVQSVTATPPGGPAAGELYAVAGSATGAWAGEDSHLAYYDGAAWVFFDPTLGVVVVSVADGEIYRRTGTDWVQVTGVSVAPLSHASSHQHGGADEVATATPGANAIPKADGSGLLDSWVSTGSTTVAGLVELATDGEALAGVAVQGNDARLSDSRAPTGPAGGGLGGTFPSPSVNGMTAGVLTDDTAHGTRGGGSLHANAIAAGAAGFMTGADKSKLDGIEAGATADQTDTEIRTALGVTDAAAVDTSAGAGDAGKAVKLDVGGRLSATFRPALTGDVTASAGSAATTIGDSTVDGGKLATVADNATTAGAMVVHPVLVPSGAAGDVDVVVDDKIEVIEAVIRLNGAGASGDTLQIKSTAAVITDAVDLNGGATGDLFRPDNITAANAVINAAGTLRVTKATSGTFPGALVLVTCIRRA